MISTSLIEKAEQIKMGHRILILLGTLALLAGLFVYFVYMPKNQEIDRYEREIASLDQQIAKAKLAKKRLDEQRMKKELVETQFQEALRLLPNEREIPNLLRTITQLGRESNLEFRLFSPKNEREKDFYKEIPVSMEVSGLYHDVAVFFDKVGKMDRIVNIIDVNIRPVNERSTELITSCEAVTYRFKKTTQPAAAEKPAQTTERR